MTAREENLVDIVPLVARDAPDLQRIARALHRLDEHSCNWGLTPRQEKREARLEQRATLIANRHGYQLYRQGDPRGWPLYLYTNANLTSYAHRCHADLPISIDSCYNSIGVPVCPR